MFIARIGRLVLKKWLNVFGYEMVKHDELIESLRTHLPELLADLKINCVLDVGAHFGEYGQFLRDIGYTERIFSFEPIAANFNRLEQCCARDPKWIARRIALGEREDVSPINVTQSTDFSSFLTPNDYCRNEFGRGGEVARVENVEIKRLDSVFEECVAGIEAPRVFLKMDTQGWDAKVLEGAGRYLGEILALESEIAVKAIYSGMVGYIDSLSRMHQMGFELTGLFPVNRRNHLVVEFNCVMKR